MFADDDDVNGYNSVTVGEKEGKRFDDGSWYTVSLIRRGRNVSTPKVISFCVESLSNI